MEEKVIKLISDATKVDQLMMEPYKRIVIMHIVIIFGGLGIQALGSPIPLLLLLIALKIGIKMLLSVTRPKLPGLLVNALPVPICAKFPNVELPDDPLIGEP